MGDFLFGVGPLRALRELASPLLDAFFLGITSTGDILFLLAAAVLVYWLWDKRLGLFLGLLPLVSGALNGVLKTLFGLPRPPAGFHRTPLPATGNGFPSGHAQTATSFWSGMAWTVRGVWISIAVAMTALVAFSRVYLGVHFVGDVLGGVAIGAALGVGGYLGFRASFWGRLSVPHKLILSVTLPAAVGLLLLVLGEDPYAIWGLLTGLSLGYVLEGEWVGMTRPRSTEAGALRIAVGLPLVGGLTLLGMSLTNPILVAPLFLAVGLTISLGLPWAFVRLEDVLLRVNR